MACYINAKNINMLLTISVTGKIPGFARTLLAVV